MSEWASTVLRTIWTTGFLAGVLHERHGARKGEDYSMKQMMEVTERIQELTEEGAFQAWCDEDVAMVLYTAMESEEQLRRKSDHWVEMSEAWKEERDG